MKMLAVFEKGPRLRLIGHLDLMRAMQRALRRSGLPIRYSQGFNPHILLTFAAPLNLGAVGLREIMEVPVDGDIAPEAFRDSLNAVLPPDLKILSCRAVEDTHKSPMALLKAARYSAVPENGTDAIAPYLDPFLARQTLPALKKTKAGEKEVDIRPMIHELTCRDGVLYATLDLREESACKMELLLKTLYAFAGLEMPHCLISRLMLLGESGALFMPLEEL